MITLAVIGAYGHRQPLAYPQIRARCLRDIRVVADPARADIVAVAHSKDLDSQAAVLRGLSRDQRAVLLSEEPFWDTIWGQDPLRRDLVHTAPDGPLAVTQLNHRTSTLYRFERIPYFLLTAEHFRTRYRVWFARNAQRRPAEWQARFAQLSGRLAFVMARRHSPRYVVGFPGSPVLSLCNLRTEIAEACQGPGTRCMGRGWSGDPSAEAPRQALVDWHLQKALDLRDRFAFVGALENTHDPEYITEKLFDAYAVGAVPLYLAQGGHRVHELAEPGSWVNLDGLAPGEVPGRLAEVETGPAFCAAYARQQQRLAQLFADREVLEAEYDRLRRALLREFTAVLG
jgi:hypothetical protein